MRFLRIAAIALSATQAAALSSKDIVAAIDGITDISSKTTDVAKHLEPGNLAQSIPTLIGDFKDIVVLALKTLKTVTSSVVTSKFEDSEQDDICKAFHDFVLVHQNLLETVIGQNGLLSKSPISAPLGAVLSVLEGGVDTLADSLLGFVPTCKDQAMKDLKALDDTLDKTIDKLAGTIPGAKAAIHAVNGVVKGTTGGIGKLADGIIGTFTGSGKGDGLFGGLFNGIFGGGKSDNGYGNSQGSPDGGIFGHLFGGDKGSSGSEGNGQGSSGGGFFGNLFGGNKGNSDSNGSGQGNSQGGFFGHLFGGGKPGNDGDSGASGSIDLSGTVGGDATSGSGSGTLSIDTGSSGGKSGSKGSSGSNGGSNGSNDGSNDSGNSDDADDSNSGDKKDSQNTQDDNNGSSNSDGSSDVRNTFYNYSFDTAEDGVITYKITVLKDKTCRYKSKRKPYSKDKLQELADKCAEKFMKDGKN